MNAIIQNYAYHLDNIRRKSKIKVDDLCDEICNPRLYRRYMTGERTLTHLKIIKFCERLGISPSDFYYSASERDRFEYKKINKLYNMISNNDFDNFFTTLKTIKKERLISSQNERYLSFCIQKANFVLKKSPPKDVFNNVAKIIDYPNCIKKNAFDFVDLVSLQLVAEIEVDFNNEVALNKLIDILANKDMIYISSESRHILPSIYANVSIFLARQKKYIESNEIAIAGISFSKLHSNFGSLTHLRYIRALSLLELGFTQEAEIEAIKCLANAISKESTYELEMFHRVLIKDFKKDPLNLIPKYKNIILQKK